MGTGKVEEEEVTQYPAVRPSHFVRVVKRTQELAVLLPCHVLMQHAGGLAVALVHHDAEDARFRHGTLLL